MTASSVEFFPCQVQLMGLSRSTTSTSSGEPGSANLEILSVGVNRRPQIQKVQRVSRNLFGAPDPIEMKNLYQMEAERQRKYILERYNFDIKSSTDDDKEDNSSHIYDNINNMNSSFKYPTVFPNLIEQELKQHDQRRQCKKQNMCRSSEDTPTNTKNCNRANCISQLTRRCEYVTALSPASDHQKPYTRQTLLTEKFNIRKSKVCSSCNTKSYSVGVITANSLEATKNLGLPQILESNTCSIKHEENTKSICKKTCVESDKDSKSALICKNKHSAVSLQLIVSTQNLS